MGKWLVAGAAALVLILLLLWRQLGDEAAPVVRSPQAVAPSAAASVPPKSSQTQLAKADPVKQGTELELDPPPAGPRKINPMSDEFNERFEEQVPRRLTREAAKCYEGRHGSLHRNQKLTLMFKTKIRDGVVTVHDVRVKEDTIQDAALNTCFIQQLQRASWKDDELPDYDVDDLLVMRPERGMRKYWSELESEVGPEGPKW